MNFNELAWGALCFYYRSAGDQKYNKIMVDTEFLTLLRNKPAEVDVAEFEQKIILSHVSIENYDLLIGHRLAETVLKIIIDLQPDIQFLKNVSLLECNLTDEDTVNRIRNIYTTLYSVQGLWVTGVSKIAHLLNDRLFVLLNLDISRHFELLDDDSSLVKWLKISKQNAQDVTLDFSQKGYTVPPEQYLSENLGYANIGYQKSLVKFIDEFFWLRWGDNLPVPPRWVPDSE